MCPEFSGHNGYLMYIRVRIHKMVLSAGSPRRYPWGHMEVPPAALEEDFLWPPVWRCTAFVTNPVAEGRNGIPPGRAQWPLPGKLIPTLPIWVIFLDRGLLLHVWESSIWFKHIILSQRVTSMNRRRKLKGQVHPRAPGTLGPADLGTRSSP